MLAAASIDALFPVAVVLLLSAHAPLMLGAGVVAGLGAGSVVYLLATDRELLLTSVRCRALLGGHMRNLLFWLSAVGRLDRPLFVAAVTFAGATAPTLIHGLTPIVYMVVLERSMGPDRYQPTGGRSVRWLMLALAGVSLVIVSQPAVSAGGGVSAVVVSVVLSVASVAAASLTALHLKWGVGYAADVAAVSKSGRCSETSASMLGTVLVSGLAVPALLAAGVVSGGSDGAAVAVLAGAAVGVTLRTPYVLMLRIANYATKTVTVNALTYLAPVMSLGLLVWFGHAAGVSVSLALSGAAVIVAANTGLAYERSRPPH